MYFIARSVRFYTCVGVIHYLCIGCFAYDPDASITGLYTGPYFDPLAQRNLSAHLGDRAVLPCVVRQLGDKSVSWVRVRGADILTVDQFTFVSDERFEAHHSPNLDTWSLVIKYVQERDAGLYECQVSTQPKMSQMFNLRVVVPQVRIHPHGDRFVKEGSEVEIECHIQQVVQQPDYIFWYRNGIRVLDQKNSNVQVIVKNTGVESMMSILTIFRVGRHESGNYTCMPSNLYSASTILHVLNEEHPAAMQDGRNSNHKMDPSINLLIILIVCQLLFRLSNECSFTWLKTLYKKMNKFRYNQKQLTPPTSRPESSTLFEYETNARCDNVLHEPSTSHDEGAGFVTYKGLPKRLAYDL